MEANETQYEEIVDNKVPGFKGLHKTRLACYDDVIKNYVKWLADQTPEVVLEKTKFNKTDYLKKYIKEKYPEVSVGLWIKWCRGVDEKIEEAKAVSANLGELSEDEFAMRAVTRRTAKALLYKKLQEMINDPQKFDRLTMKEARELYVAIRKEEDSDRTIMLKMIEVKDKHDEITLLRDKLQGGFLPSNVIAEIKTALTDIIHRHETGILDNGTNDNKYIAP